MSDMSTFMGVFRAQGPDERRKVTKRNRQPVSCVPCRQKKLKCDRQQPCGACTRRGDTSCCEFGPVTAVPIPRPKDKARSEAQIRLQKLEEMVNGLISSRTNNGNIVSSNDSAAKEVHEKLRDLDVSTSAPSSRDMAGYYLSSKDTEVSFVGATHWVAILESINDIKGYLEAENVLGPSETPDSRSSNSTSSMNTPSTVSTFPSTVSSSVKQDLIMGLHEPFTIQTALQALPERSYVDNMLSLYFTNKFFSAPFLHSVKFQREYNEFRKSPESTPLMFISVLFSVLCITSGIIHASGKANEWPSHAIDSRRFMYKAEQAIVTADYHKAQPYVIEAMLLHTHSKFLKSIDSEPSLWSFAGLTVRLAQKMGMHRDPARLSIPITPFQAEMRRRMWFHCETFDIMLSFQLGMPPIIHENESDIGPPRNLLPADFDEDTKELPPERPETDDSPMLFFAYKSRFIRLFRKVQRHALSTRQPAYSETMAIDAELHALHDVMPERLRIKPVREAPFSDSTSAIMKRMMLETLYLKGLVVLHRNYLTYEKENSTFSASRLTAVNSALTLLDLQEEYHRETSPGGRVYEERWMMSTLTLHDFLMSAMIICLDLSELPQRSAEERDRKIQTLRTSHRIWNEKRAISRDADHAVSVIGAMLAKVSAPDQVGVIEPKPNSVSGVGFNVGAGKTFANTSTTVPGSESGPPLLAVGESPPLTDESFEFMDLDSLDEMLSNTENLDWNAVDQYLRDLGNEQPHPGQLNFHAVDAAMLGGTQ